MIQYHKPRILLDLDDVTVDLATDLTKTYNESYGDRLTPEELFVDWNIHKRAKCGDEIYKIFQRENFFYSLKPKPGAISAIQSMLHLFEIVIVTSITRSPEAAKDKVKWIRDYMPFYELQDLIMTKRKELVSGDIMIDDSVKNLERWSYANPAGMPVLFAAHHNVLQRKDFKHVVHNWNDVLELLGKVYCGEKT
jgi:5'(3')-deoxyribonucleotidase